MLSLRIPQLAATLMAALSAMVYAAPSGLPTTSIHAGVNDVARVVLRGNTRPEATAANDRGRVDDAMPMPHLQLQLKRTPEREAALNQFIADLHNPKSASYHQWLTPEQFALHYGVAQEDVAAVSSWLLAKGFSVDGVTPTGLMIEFSGTAGLVRNAFHTEVHKLSVNGVAHFANISDPEIPAALVPAVVGVVSLNDFRARAMNQQGVDRPELVAGTGASTKLTLTPGDLATIYNLKPLYAAGITGKGQTIMILQNSMLFSTNDWTVFRKTFGLTRAYPYGSLTQMNPTGALTCSNPGVSTTRGDLEASIDVEWSTAAAPNAAIVSAVCADSSTTFGGLIALQNVLNGPAAGLPNVVSLSFGEPEIQLGATASAATSTLYQQAIAEGVSVFVAAGDFGATAIDVNANAAESGLAVSGFASTPFNVAVGGTDFAVVPNGNDPAAFFGAINSNTFSSALSYMPEVPWNASCAGSVMVAYLAKTNPAFAGATPASVCNSINVQAISGPQHALLTTGAGGGGPSATYSKPSWQQLVGNPSDGARDLPDVSLMASNGIWNAIYGVCWSNTSASLNPSPVTPGAAANCLGAPGTWPSEGGTSVSTPIMAGIQALVNQKTGSNWGNPNTVYYQMANTEYGSGGNSACNSTTVNKTSNSCVFYDITQGDTANVCKLIDAGFSPINCFINSRQNYGITSTSNTVLQPAFSATAGWDFATGIGSVNAYNLVMGWPAP